MEKCHAIFIGNDNTGKLLYSIGKLKILPTQIMQFKDYGRLNLFKNIFANFDHEKIPHEIAYRLFNDGHVSDEPTRIFMCNINGGKFEAGINSNLQNKLKQVNVELVKYKRRYYELLREVKDLTGKDRFEKEMVQRAKTLSRVRDVSMTASEKFQSQMDPFRRY